jgi:hypothetical protein
MFSDLTELRIKGWAYAQRPDEFYEWLDEEHVKFKGDDGDHLLTLQDGEWHCDCARFASLKREKYVAVFCQHTLGLERALPSIKPVRVSDLAGLLTLFHKEAPCLL